MDDGIATRATIRAAIAALQEQRPRKIVVAVPVIALDAYQTIGKDVDEMVRLMMPTSFRAIALWYENFAQTTDEEVCRRLNQRAGRTATQL